MPQHKSPKKRMKVSAKKQIRNSNGLASIRTAIKKLITAIEAKTPRDKLKTLFSATQSEIQSGASKGFIKKSNAARKIERLAHRMKVADTKK